ncbi:MAG: DNA glycosylase AlkZ-like family protein, partial [Pseudonocardiaceae bacterium]
MTHGETLSDAELGRALLARQGLLERLDSPIPQAVERLGAMQAQHWPALPVALWSRCTGFVAADLYAALQQGELVTGQLIRGTLHLVSSAEYPQYAAVAAESGSDSWHRTKEPPTEGMRQVRQRMAHYAAEQPRSGAQLSAFVENAVGSGLRDDPTLIATAELQIQRNHSWRAFSRWSGLVRVPESGKWNGKKPAAYAAAPAAVPGSD